MCNYDIFVHTIRRKWKNKYTSTISYGFFKTSNIVRSVVWSGSKKGVIKKKKKSYNPENPPTILTPIENLHMYSPKANSVTLELFNSPLSGNCTRNYGNYIILYYSVVYIKGELLLVSCNITYPLGRFSSGLWWKRPWVGRAVTRLIIL